MQGHTVYRTKCGGFVGFAIAIIILAFTITRSKKMITRDDPTLAMIDQGLDLAGSHTDEYNLGQHGYTFGITAFTSNGITIEAVDIEDLFDVQF